MHCVPDSFEKNTAAEHNDRNDRNGDDQSDCAWQNHRAFAPVLTIAPITFQDQALQTGGRYIPAASARASILFSRCISSLCSGLTSRTLPFAVVDV